MNEVAVVPSSNMIDLPTDAVNQNVGYAKLLENLSELKQMLVDSDPDIATYVKQIHKDLVASPELIHMLKPEEVNILVQGVDCLNDFSFAKSQETKRAVKTTKAVAKKESLKDMLDLLADGLS